jgi:hypothetical protein
MEEPGFRAHAAHPAGPARAIAQFCPDVVSEMASLLRWPSARVVPSQYLPVSLPLCLDIFPTLVVSTEGMYACKHHTATCQQTRCIR